MALDDERRARLAAGERRGDGENSLPPPLVVIAPPPPPRRRRAATAAAPARLNRRRRAVPLPVGEPEVGALHRVGGLELGVHEEDEQHVPPLRLGQLRLRVAPQPRAAEGVLQRRRRVAVARRPPPGELRPRRVDLPLLLPAALEDRGRAAVVAVHVRPLAVALGRLHHRELERDNRPQELAHVVEHAGLGIVVGGGRPRTVAFGAVERDRALDLRRGHRRRIFPLRACAAAPERESANDAAREVLWVGRRRGVALRCLCHRSGAGHRALLVGPPAAAAGTNAAAVKLSTPSRARSHGASARA